MTSHFCETVDDSNMAMRTSAMEVAVAFLKKEFFHSNSGSSQRVKFATLFPDVIPPQGRLRIRAYRDGDGGGGAFFSNGRNSSRWI
jgi:hypothetical protein